jgi:hypothetical protein
MFSFTVERQDAEAIRSLLDTFPVIYTVRRRWIFWRRFTVDGMDPDVVRMALDEAHWLKSSLWFGRLERSQKDASPSDPTGRPSRREGPAPVGSDSAWSERP